MKRGAKRTRSPGLASKLGVTTVVLLASFGADVPRARAAPEEGEAQTYPPPVDNRPFGRGTWGVSPTLGIGFSSDLIPLTLGAGGSYFVANGLGLGLSVNDTILIYTSSFKARFPDVQNQIPTNSVYVTPTMRYVFYRNRRFSPYVFGALGPVFFNHGGGTRGYWAAGPGAFIGLGGPIYLNLGIVFSGIFPTDQCRESFEYTDPSTRDRVQFDLGCGFGWGPNIGISFLPRARRPRTRRKRSEPRPPPAVPARNPLAVPAEPEPPPEPVAPPSPEPVPDPPPPAVPPPTDPPAPDAVGADPTPSEGPPADVPPMPDAPPPTAVQPINALAVPGRRSRAQRRRW